VERHLIILTVGVLALTAASCTSVDNGSSSEPVGRVDGSTGRAGIATGAEAPAIPDLDPIADLATADLDEVHLSYAPEVPPPIDRTDQRTFEVHLEVVETICPLDPASGTSTETWGYRRAGDDHVQCGSPGPVIRGRVGDLVHIVLTNPPGNLQAHNIDFHAVTGQGGGAAGLTVAPGDTGRIDVRLLYPGVFMYHCAYGDVPKHIAHGMYGMFIVDPPSPLPPADHEWAVMQSEWYVDEADQQGLARYDAESLTAENPRWVTFNGRTDALVGDHALHMSVGERARFYLVNEGLNLASNWHPIGSHWDVVRPEGATHPDNPVIRGSQSTLVVAGGGTITELVGFVPSTVILVDHALVRTFVKGAIGQVVVDGPPDPEIYAEPQVAQTTTTAPNPAGALTVSMPDGAWNPANADTAYLPAEIRVEIGDTVTWINDDTVIHTVTSGTSTGVVTTADDLFGSGPMAPGDSFSHTFTEAGTFDYFCTPHPWMTGTVVVDG
jgi:nitrite reductase (NO-forming)